MPDANHPQIMIGAIQRKGRSQSFIPIRRQRGTSFTWYNSAMLPPSH
jgi:hypothetical protein